MGGKILSFGFLAACQALLVLCWLFLYLQSRHRKKSNVKPNNEKEHLLHVTADNRETSQADLTYWQIIRKRQQLAVQLMNLISYGCFSFIEPQLSNMMHTIDATASQG